MNNMSGLAIQGYVAGVTSAVVVEGPEAGSFLQGLISQDVERVQEIEAIRSFLLGPRGKFRSLMWLIRRADAFWLFTDSPENLLEDLRRFHLRVDCTITQYEGPVLDVLGARPSEETGGVVAHIPWKGVERWIVAGVEPELLSLDQLHEGEWTAVRVGAGEPEMGRDVDEGTIPQESGLVPDAVSFTKGCYLGQELVARIDSRGRVNKRLVLLEIDNGEAPPAGARIEVGGDDVGVVSSSARKLDGTGSVALAMVPARVTESVMVTWGDASVEAHVSVADG
ncbi:MAG: folate-binding protein YgfZ [Acidimicrobiia bacterium]|nr:folate-binding protein YgfZ [Acidimicrobiia bacterium]